MKKLLVGLIVLTNISTQAGEIINRKSGDVIELNILEHAKVIKVETDFEYKEVPLRIISKSTMSTSRALLPETTTIITGYDGYCGTEIWKDMDSKRKLGRVAELVLMTPIALVVDLVSLPKSGIEEAQMKSDKKIIRKAITSNRTYKVSSKRFKRLKAYFGLRE